MQNSQVKAGKMKTSRQNKAYYRALEDDTEKQGYLVVMLKSQLNYLSFKVVVCSFTLLCSVLILKHFVAFEKWCTNQVIISSCGRRNKS